MEAACKLGGAYILRDHFVEQQNLRCQAGREFDYVLASFGLLSGVRVTGYINIVLSSLQSKLYLDAFFRARLEAGVSHR
jgi:hypothetical protein